MLKIMTLVGTRPEIIKMSRVIAELDKFVEHILVHSGQNYDYELNQIFFDELEIRKPNYFLNISKEKPALAIADVIAKSDALFESVKPDALMLYGDTNTCMAVIPAKKRKIPIFHMEAGNRCFNQRVPEEINRKIVDHLSDINMVLTEHARRYLIAEGINQERIFKTGSHMAEVLNYYKDKIQASKILDTLNIIRGKYFVVSAHREENVDYPDKLNKLITSIVELATIYKLPIIFSVHPRTKDRIQKYIHQPMNDLIHFHKPLGFIDYIKLQKSAFCVLSDSGTLTEEASILNIPAIMIREEHERPEGMDVGSVIMSGLDSNSILDSVRVTTEHQNANVKCTSLIQDYQYTDVSKQILKIILSYINYVNKKVWGITS